jgi:hypothetical protein
VVADSNTLRGDICNPAFRPRTLSKRKDRVRRACFWLKSLSVDRKYWNPAPPGANARRTAMNVTLYITPAENQPGNYLVVVNGDGFYNSVNKKVGARIRGEDKWFDNTLFSIGGTGIERVGGDGSFSLSNTVSAGQLNEDWGEDEVYALVSVEGLSGSFRSNTIKRDF